MSSRLHRLVGCCGLLLLFLMGGCSKKVTELPVLAELSGFSLQDQDAKAFGDGELRGKIWVVNFIFTRCPSVCPKLTKLMAGLQKEMRVHGEGVAFLSVSVDPEHDTPPVLKAYAQKYQADEANWRFLTGDAAKVRQAVVKGFRVMMGDPTPVGDGTVYDVMHANHLLVLDDSLKVRGYFRIDEEGINDLRDAVAFLAKPQAVAAR